MQINGQEVYLYAPQDVKRWTQDELEKEVSILIQKFNPDADTMYQYANNIEIMSNIQYLFGEFIVRYSSQYEKKKNEVDANESKFAYTLRNGWEGEGKPPAMTYFEAQASELVRKDREEVINCKETVERYKRAYETYTEKINALKWKIKSLGYEEFGEQS